jgi:two-component system OmpR family sensor kinase
MRDSLRARLLFWHVAAGAAIIVTFGVAVCLLVWHSRLSAIDTGLRLHAAALDRAVRPTDNGQVDLILDPGLRQVDASGIYHFVWTREGVLIDRSDTDRAVPEPGPDGPRFAGGHRELAATAASGVRLLVGADLAPLRSDIRALATNLLAAGGGILLLSVAAGWWMLGRALAPLGRINLTARRMAEGDLSARIPDESADSEVGQLVTALNSAFDRLHGAIERQRRFTADASHELRTPLATLSAEVQWALARDRARDELRSSLEVCGRAAARMQAVIERLLFLARGQAVAAETHPVRLDDVAREAVDHTRALSYASGLTVEVDLAPVSILANRERLLEAVTNVVTNALRYNVPAGRVTVETHLENGRAVLRVADTGIGIAAEDLPHVFDPFFRGDPARSRDTGGAGLGLAVARTVAEEHGGTIHCDSAPGRGTTVTMTWPADRVVPGTEPSRPA